MLTRRNLLKTSAGVLVAAPAIVQASSLMKIFVPSPTDPRFSKLDLQLDLLEKAWSSANIAIHDSIAQMLAYQQYHIDKSLGLNLLMDPTKKYRDDVAFYHKRLDVEISRRADWVRNCK